VPELAGDLLDTQLWQMIWERPIDTRRQRVAILVFTFLSLEEARLVTAQSQVLNDSILSSLENRGCGKLSFGYPAAKAVQTTLRLFLITCWTQ
jgi:hypothetical protein